MDNIQEVRNINIIATEINTIKAHANQILLSSAIEIGKRLKEAKELSGHGNWATWLKEEVSYSQRTASNLMKIYEEYGQKIEGNQIGKQLADLGYTQAIAMLKLDFEEREAFVVENDMDGMSTRELEQAVKEKAELIEEKKQLKEQLEWQTDQNSKVAQELKEKLDHIEAIEEELQEKNRQVQELNEAVSNRPEQEDPKVLQEKEEALLKTKAEIKELKKKLKEKPETVEVEIEKIVEVVPEAVQQELDSLRLKLTSSDNQAKFKSTFDLLMSTFNNLLSILTDIKDDNEEEYEKYKSAVNKLLERLVISD